MKNLFLFVCLSAFSFGFSQSKDLTKKQALEAFKNSELRKELKIPVSKFDKIYNQAKCVKVNYRSTEEKQESDLLKTMPIFLKKKPKDYDLQTSIGYRPFSMFGHFFHYGGKEMENLKLICL